MFMQSVSGAAEQAAPISQSVSHLCVYVFVHMTPSTPANVHVPTAGDRGPGGAVWRHDRRPAECDVRQCGGAVSGLWALGRRPSLIHAFVYQWLQQHRLVPQMRRPDRRRAAAAACRAATCLAGKGVLGGRCSGGAQAASSQQRKEQRRSNPRIAVSALSSTWSLTPRPRTWHASRACPLL